MNKSDWIFSHACFDKFIRELISIMVSLRSYNINFYPILDNGLSSDYESLELICLISYY